MKTHAPLLPLAVCLMAGIAASEWIADWTTALWSLAGAVAISLALGRWPRWQTAGIAVCALLTGLTLGSRQRQQQDVAWPKEPLELETIVIDEPVVRDRWVVTNMLTADGRHKLRCHIARDNWSEQITVGDGILMSAAVEAGVCFVKGRRWRWQDVTLSHLSVVQRARLRFLSWRHTLLQRYRQWGMADEAYGIIAAMTLGEKSQLNPALKDTYSRVGASHILALSGLHLMIIYTVLSLLTGWHRFRTASQAVIILAIWAFALLTGLSPSVTRSATMISIYALLSLGYRERMSVNTLAFTAILMLAINPHALYDLGFQLSFTAVLAILLFNPLFHHLIAPHVLQQHRWLAGVWGLLTVSLSAQIGTAPLIIYYFGRFSTYFLLSNLIVIPLATILLYTALTSLCLWWWPWLHQWLVAALTAVASLMNRLLERVAALPYSSIDGISLSTLQLSLLYVMIGGLYIFLYLLLSHRVFQARADM